MILRFNIKKWPFRTFSTYRRGLAGWKAFQKLLIEVLNFFLLDNLKRRGNFFAQLLPHKHMRRKLLCKACVYWRKMHFLLLIHIVMNIMKAYIVESEREENWELSSLASMRETREDFPRSEENFSVFFLVNLKIIFDRPLELNFWEVNKSLTYNLLIFYLIHQVTIKILDFNQ